MGPGKYDDLATYVREHAEAEAVVVIVLAGNNGSGFSVQAHARSAQRLQSGMARLLRQVADDIDAEEEGTG
jgi:hypothetical protein